MRRLPSRGFDVRPKPSSRPSLQARQQFLEPCLAPELLHRRSAYVIAQSRLTSFRSAIEPLDCLVAVSDRRMSKSHLTYTVSRRMARSSISRVSLLASFRSPDNTAARTRNCSRRPWNAGEFRSSSVRRSGLFVLSETFMCQPGLEIDLHVLRLHLVSFVRLFERRGVIPLHVQPLRNIGSDDRRERINLFRPANHRKRLVQLISGEENE